MLHNEGFCQQKEHLQTWRIKCLSPSFVWLPDRTSALSEVCVPYMYFHIFHIFVSWYICLCSEVFSKTCPRLLHGAVFYVCGFLVCSSVFKSIEANTCLLLYNWAVNVNRVITNLAQNVFFFLPFAIRDQLIEGHFEKKPSLVKEEWPGLCSTLLNLALINLGTSLLWRRTAAQ